LFNLPELIDFLPVSVLLFWADFLGDRLGTAQLLAGALDRSLPRQHSPNDLVVRRYKGFFAHQDFSHSEYLPKVFRFAYI